MHSDGELRPVGPLWFSESALAQARAVYLVPELVEGARLFGPDFVTGPLNASLRGIGRQPLVLAWLPVGRVVVLHSDEAASILVVGAADQHGEVLSVASRNNPRGGAPPAHQSDGSLLEGTERASPPALGQVLWSAWGRTWWVVGPLGLGLAALGYLLMS